MHLEKAFFSIMQNKTDKGTLLVSKSLPVVNSDSVNRLFSTRKKKYYDSLHEDGEDRCSIETHNEICSSLATLLSDSIDVGNTNVKYSLVITSTHKTKHSFNNQGLSPQVIKAIVNLLANHIDEFTFLTAFTHFI